MSETEALEIANKIVEPHGLKADFLGEVYSVGVGGDHRTYTRIIVLIGSYPGDDILASLSTEISNSININRVAFELAQKN